MNVTFLGCRGSTPVSGSAFSGHGQSTSCVALSRAGDAVPSLVLDAGTGFVHLGPILGDRPFQGTVLLTHLHWDHTHGLPFLRNASLPGHRVRIVLPEQGRDPLDVLEAAFSPPHFPVRARDLGEDWTFLGIDPGTHEFEGFSVRAEEIPHKGGRTFGYRIDDGESVVAYLPDHRPLALGPGPDGLGTYHPAAMTLAAHADLLIHDAQHTATELPDRAYLGHSAMEYAIGLGAAAGVAEVVLFHHDPQRTDADLDGILDRLDRRSVVVTAAREGSRRHLCP